MQFTLRVPEQHGEQYRVESEAAGFAHVNDYLAYKLAEVHGLTRGEANSQQPLPLAPDSTAVPTPRRTSAA